MYTTIDLLFCKTQTSLEKPVTLQLAQDNFFGLNFNLQIPLLVGLP